MIGLINWDLHCPFCWSCVDMVTLSSWRSMVRPVSRSMVRRVMLNCVCMVAVLFIVVGGSIFLSRKQIHKNVLVFVWELCFEDEDAKAFC